MKRILILALAASLAACMTGNRRGGEAGMAVYDFGGTPPPRQATATDKPLALEVRAPLWLDTPALQYRLAYHEPERLREYAQSRWAGAPAQLIQHRLQLQLGHVPAGQGRAACTLRLELAEFNQVFATAERSEAVLQGRLLLLDRTRRVLAGESVDIRVPAEAPDARGGVHALTLAVDRLGGRILAWETGEAAAGVARACGG